MVQKGKDRAGVDVGFVDAAKDPHDEGSIHSCGQAFADHVADVETDEAVRQAKKIDEISADLEEGSGAECDFNTLVAQRCAGKKGILNQVSFAHVILADATTSEVVYL
jgi:hypothetical protein